MRTDSTTLSTLLTTVTTTPTTTTTVTTTTTPEALVFTMVSPGPMLTECNAACASGWLYYGSKCYKKFTSPLTYSEASSSCIAEGAQIVTITSSDENEALRKAFDTNALVSESQETWIGLQLANGTKKWADGTSLSFTNWAPTQPVAGQYCVQMITDALDNAAYKYQRGGWKTFACSQTSASYICEKAAGSG